MWRLIIDGARSGVENMAIDEALLQLAERNAERKQTTLRIYKWSEPTLSLGYSQRPEEAADLRFCALRGIPIVRRPTGGRAVLHDCELTYSIVSNDPRLFNIGSSYRDPTSAYSRIGRALSRALSSLGLHIDDSGHERRPEPRANYLRLRPPCFVTAARYDIICRGKKIVGSAQRRLRSSFLQHGSLLLDCDFALMASVTGTDEQLLRSFLTTIRSESPRDICEEEIILSIRRAFELEFGVEFVPSALSDGERSEAESLMMEGRYDCV